MMLVRGGPPDGFGKSPAQLLRGDGVRPCCLSIFGRQGAAPPGERILQRQPKPVLVVVAHASAGSRVDALARVGLRSLEIVVYRHGAPRIERPADHRGDAARR